MRDVHALLVCIEYGPRLLYIQFLNILCTRNTATTIVVVVLVVVIDAMNHAAGTY